MKIKIKLQNKYVLIFIILIGLISCSVKNDEFSILAPYGSNYSLETGTPVYLDSIIIGRVSSLELNNNGDIVVNLKFSVKIPENPGFCYFSSIISNYIVVATDLDNDTLMDCNQNKNKLNQIQKLEKISNWIEAIDTIQ